MNFKSLVKYYTKEKFVKNIKKIVLGFSTVALFGLAACDSSSIGEDNSHVNTSGDKTDLTSASTTEKMLPSLLENVNYVIDLKNTLADYLDPDVLGANNETKIEIRLTTDIGSNEGITLIEEKYTDLTEAVPTDGLFSEEYLQEMITSFGRPEYNTKRVIVSREDIKSAIIQDLSESQAISKERASELAVIFNVSPDRLYEINPAIEVTATDLIDSEGIGQTETYRLEIKEWLNTERPEDDKRFIDVTDYTSINYDIVSDDIISRTNTDTNGDSQTQSLEEVVNAAEEAIKDEPREADLETEEEAAAPIEIAPLEINIPNTLNSTIEQLAAEQRAEVEKRAAYIGTVRIEDPETTPAYSKDDL